jgi:MFS family permease
MSSGAPAFYGWRVVQGSLVVAFIAWAFALYGPGVYIHALSQQHGWPVGTISAALTVSFLVNAVSIGFVGAIIGRYGPRFIMAAGALIMAAGLAAIGQITEPWQAFVAFAVMGLGWSCLSTIAISSTVSPWFERLQGRAISIALLGASLGGMFGVPIALFFVAQLGLAHAMIAIACVVVAVVVPISLGVLKRHPSDLGLYPDGQPPAPVAAQGAARIWPRRDALQTFALRSVIITFGLALMVQLGFLSQQVKLLQDALSATQTGATVLASGSLAFLGRIVLARLADHVNIRNTAAAVLIMAALGLAVAASATTPTQLVIGTLIFGFNVGNLTTLPALIVRREFGAASFGRIFGVTGTFMQTLSAMGPAVFGLLHDLTGRYGLPIGLAGAIMLASAALIRHGQPVTFKRTVD